MFTGSSNGPGVRVSEDPSPSETVTAGFSSVGLAGLTAVDYLTDHLDLEPRGHVSAEGVPTITPFEAGRPRQPTRFHAHEGIDATLLRSEQFIPLQLADRFGSRCSTGWPRPASAR